MVGQLDKETVENFILSFPGVSVDQPFKQPILVYRVGQDDQSMFALLNKDKLPLRLSLRCEPKLSQLLRDKYEEVMPGDHLDSKNWNTIVLSGQLSLEEIKDLIRHSYDIVSARS